LNEKNLFENKEKKDDVVESSEFIEAEEEKGANAK
jgi:hypothetical protein